MRTSTPTQMTLPRPIAKQKKAQELEAVSQLLDDNPELAEMVAADLGGHPGASQEVGRPGMTGDLVLRSSIVRVLEDCSYDELEFYIGDSRTYCWFCRLPWGEEAPSASTLQENIRRVRPETWLKVNQKLVGVAVKMGIETGKKVRIDCTVTESNIHPPDDAAQLYDSVRVLVRLLRQAVKLRTGVVVHCRERRSKRRWKEVMDSKDEKRKAAYRDLIRVAREVIGWADSAIPLLREGAVVDDDASRLAEKISHHADLGKKVIDQTQRRVFEGEKVPSSEKVVSIFEEHTDIIVKDRRDVSYGHKLLLTTGASGLVAHCDVLEGNPNDSTLVGQALDATAAALGKMPRQAALDGGFASKDGLALARKKGVKDVCFSKRRGMAIVDMAKSVHVYRKLWRFRAGIEAGISFLKRCFGLSRCNWKGKDGFHAYVQSSVVAFNILLIGRKAAA
jgi:transposase, IS5 family